jgi:hypothetical protein
MLDRNQCYIDLQFKEPLTSDEQKFFDEESNL